MHHLSGIEYFIIANPILTYALIFVGMFIEGEGLIIFASVFAWQGHLNWAFLILAVLAGTIAGDLLWYAGGRFLRKTRLGNWLDRRYEKHTDNLDTNIREHYGRLAILSKFMYFTTHPTIFLVGWNKFPFKRFLWITFYATTVWALSVLAVGYFFGYAIELIGYKRVVHRIEIFAILLFLAVFIFGRLIKKAITRSAKCVSEPLISITRGVAPIRGASGSVKPASIYEQAPLLAKLNEQVRRQTPETAFFTDIDNTFHKKGHEQATTALQKCLEKLSIPLIAISGVRFDKILERIRSGELPYFDAIGGAVGTELFILSRGKNGEPEYHADPLFQKNIRALAFDRPRLIAKAAAFIANTGRTEPAFQFNFQVPEEERAYIADNNAPHQAFKISFHFFADNAGRDRLTQLLRNTFPKQETIICEEINHNRTLPKGAPIKKYCADILPISKAGVVAYLTKLLALKKAIIAGDSGNDVEMLTEYAAPLETLSILVGGHTDEAVQKMEALTGAWKTDSSNLRRNGNRFVYVESAETTRQAAETILHVLKSRFPGLV